AVRYSAGAVVEFTVPEETEKALRALARRTGATMFMTLLAVFDVLLSRYTGQDDIVVGTPIANRNRTEVEGLIGFFVNTLVLRTDLSGDPTFAELLARVRDDALGGYAHQDLPFEHLVEALQPERDRSRTALFQVMFIFLGDQDASDMGDDPLGGTSLDVQASAAKFDVTLLLAGGSDGLSGAVEFATELFDRSTVERLVGHLVGLLGVVAGGGGGGVVW